jgi:hypothetical protein
MATASAELATKDCDDLAVFRRVLEKNAGMWGQVTKGIGNLLGRTAPQSANVIQRGARTATGVAPTINAARNTASHVAPLQGANAVARGARAPVATRRVNAAPVLGTTPAAAAKAPAAAAAPEVPLGQRVSKGWSEFKAGLGTGRRLGIGSSEAAQAAPSLWKSVGHNMADQAVGGAIGGTVLGGALGAYQAPKGEGMSGALAGAGEGVKAGLVGGALAGAAGGALRHGRYKALLHSGQSPAAATAVMSKNPLQNVQDAWKNRANAGSWEADALEAAAVPATLAAEGMAQSIGEKKQASADTVQRIVSKIAADLPAKPRATGKLKKRCGRAAMHLSRAEEAQLITAARAILRAVRDTKAVKHANVPQLIVVPMMQGAEKSHAERLAEKRDRDAHETDTAVGKGVGPLAGAVGAEALLRGTLDPAVRANPTGPLAGLAPDSVSRKILLPGLGAAIGAYGAHRVIQARREARERATQAELAQEAARAALPAGSAPSYP